MNNKTLLNLKNKIKSSNIFLNSTRISFLKNSLTDNKNNNT